MEIGSRIAAEATASETTTERHRRVVGNLVERRGDLVDRRAELQCSHRLDVEAVELGRRAPEELVQIGRFPVVEDMTQRRHRVGVGPLAMRVVRAPHHVAHTELLDGLGLVSRRKARTHGAVRVEVARG